MANNTFSFNKFIESDSAEDTNGRIPEIDAYITKRRQFMIDNNFPKTTKRDCFNTVDGASKDSIMKGTGPFWKWFIPTKPTERDENGTQLGYCTEDLKRNNWKMFNKNNPDPWSGWTTVGKNGTHGGRRTTHRKRRSGRSGRSRTRRGRTMH